VPPVALVGNLSYDLVDGSAPQIGGAPIHCGRALRLLDARATILARCADADLPEFRRGFAELGVPARLLSGTATTTFAFSYDGDTRTGSIERIGDVWRADDVQALPPGAWVHVGALLRGDFTADVIASLARGRRVSFDAQGLTRVRELGTLRLEGDLDAGILRHVSILKLAVEEAEALVGRVSAHTLARLGPPEVVVTYGSEGSLVVDRGRATEVRTRHVDADPTGSGDAFAISYLVGRARGHSPVASARRASAVVADMLRARIA
jgi:sugar/nucleoside kinase (ribokinase family)